MQLMLKATGRVSSRYRALQQKWYLIVEYTKKGLSLALMENFYKINEK